MAISYVQDKGSWLYIYNEQAKKSVILSSSNGELMGVGNDFIILLKGSWIYTFDKKGKKKGTKSAH